MSILLTSKYDFSHTLRGLENLIFQNLLPVCTGTTFLGEILKNPCARTLALGRGPLALDPPKNHSWAPKSLLGPSWTLLGALGTLLGRSWDALGTLLGLSWSILGPSWPVLGPSWTNLVSTWANLASSLVPRCFPIRFLIKILMISYPPDLDFCNTLQCF